MAQKPKDVQLHNFTEGMDSDTAPSLMPATRARYMLNVRASSLGEVGVVTNVKGNVLVTTPLPAGVNKVIGPPAADAERNRFYFPVWNDGGYHTWLRYDGVSNIITVILQSKTDSNGIDILNFNPDYMILSAEVIQGDKLYWTDNGWNKARKFNINKALDKSDAGYGLVIIDDYINAYKKAPALPPAVIYFSDTTRNSNFTYGQLFKFAYRNIFDDSEISHVSEFSPVAIPPNESYLGAKNITYDNNCIQVSLNTGPSIVKKFEILVKSGDGDWLSIGVFDKSDLQLGDNSTYVYNFYNDGSYTAIDQEKVIKPFSVLPYKPKNQAFLELSMAYSNFPEGFDSVKVIGDALYSNEELYLPSGTVNQLNEPSITVQEVAVETERALVRANRYNVTTSFTIGFDVKKGNIFRIYGKNGKGDNLEYSYEAKQSDTAVSVANILKSFLRGLYRGLPQPDNGIANESTDGLGNVTFEYKYLGKWRENKIVWTGYVNAVSFASLQDNGLSIPIIKSGSTRKYGIVFEDDDGRKSLTNTTDPLLVKTPFITEVGGIKRTIHTITLKSRPPVWAKYFHLVRTDDYTNFIQLLIQQVIDVNEDADVPGAYIDLIVGSLFTYQKMHPNTVLTYEFAKGDRMRLIKNTTDQSLYPYFETEILSYEPGNTTEDVNSNVTVNGSAEISVEAGVNARYVGKSIVINGVERVITAISLGKYELDTPIAIGTTDDPIIVPGYKFIDRRGIVRIKKPANITIADFSTVELFKPQRAVSDAYKRFYDFGHKYLISNYGTDTRAFRGNIQDQDGTTDITAANTPAIIRVVEGDAYARNRELPTSNVFPGTQVVVEAVEDANFSDFYDSDLRSLGRVYPQDDGSGAKRFGSRIRYSNGYIEDTKINGLNDFDNTDREDYNDSNGDIQLMKFIKNRLYIFKELLSGWIPVNQSIITDAQGSTIVGLSSKLLGKFQKYDWPGGIGNNPESWFQGKNYQYFASTNSGAFMRIAGDGCDPISKQFFYDKDAREILANVHNNNLKLIGGFDPENDEAVWSAELFKKQILNQGFSENGWQLMPAFLPAGTTYVVTTEPAHGTVALNGDGIFEYTPTAGYLGPNSFFFKAILTGGAELPPVKQCITVVETPNRQIGYVKDSTKAYCTHDGDGDNDGYQGWKELKAIYLDDLSSAGLKMPNIPTITQDAIVPTAATITFNAYTSPIPSGGADGDVWYNLPTNDLYKRMGSLWNQILERVTNDFYVAPVYNLTDCPLPGPPDPPDDGYTIINKTGKNVTYFTDPGGVYIGQIGAGNSLHITTNVQLRVSAPYVNIPVYVYQPNGDLLATYFNSYTDKLIFGLPDEGGRIWIGQEEPPV